jgi:hypothetical protein
MQRLAFIPRKWRLTRWQALLGAAATFAWWGFMGYSIPAADPLWKDPLLILFIASWVIPAWLVYWLFVTAVRRASANIPLVARALAEIAAFAAMIGVAMLVTYLFPERHFWHGEVSRDAAYSPLVFAATLVCEVAMYIAARFLYARAPVAVKEPKPLSAYRPEREIDSGERQEAATDPGSYSAPSYEVGEARAVPTEREIVRVDARRWPFVTLGNVSFAVAVVLIGSYLLMALGPQENTGSEDKSLRIAPTVPATADQKPPAEYANLRLGMAMAEVINVKGFPQKVIQNPENLKKPNKTEWWLAYLDVYSTNTFNNGQHVEDYRTWLYELDNRGTRIDVGFDATTKTLNQITCFSQGETNCPHLLGILDGTRESAILEKLSKPTYEKINGVSKEITYENLGVFFYLSKQRVYMLGVRSVAGETHAPACKNGAASCEPWERDWHEGDIKPGSVVTEQGQMFKPKR